MTKIVHYSADTGQIIGFYDPDVHDSESMPAPTIEITESDWMAAITNPGSHRIIGSEIVNTGGDVELSVLADRKRAEIAMAFSANMGAGMTYAMPGGLDDIVQTRVEDKINLLGLSITAERLKGQGVTDPVHKFRAGSNVVYDLTPDEMLAMTNAALMHIEGIYKKSWVAKDALEEAVDAGDQVALEAISWPSV